MKKFISKPLLISGIVTFCILILLGLSFLAKAYLTANKQKIEKNISNYFKKQVEIASIHYVPPVFIILKDVTILESKNTLGYKYSPLSVQRITLVFSIKELLNNQNLVINKIYFFKPKIDSVQYPLFLKENIQKIVGFINVLSQGRPLKIIIEEALLVRRRFGSKINALIVDCKIQTQAKRYVESVGALKLATINEDNFDKNLQLENQLDKNLKYQLRGAMVKEGMVIDRLNIEYLDLRAGFKGRLHNSVLNLKGNSTIENFFTRALIPQSEKGELFKKIKQLILYQRISQKIGISAGGLNVVDIDCRIKFASKKARIEKLDCFVQNVPLRLTGEIGFDPETVFNINLLTFPDQKDELRKKNPKRVDALLECQIKNNKFNADIETVFSRIVNKKIIQQNIQMSFYNASFGISPDERVKFFVEKLAVLYSLRGNNHSLLLHDFDSIFNFINKDIKFIKFKSQMFNGELTGYVAVNLAYRPLKISYVLNVSNASANELDSVLLSLIGKNRKLPQQFPGRIYGILSGNLNYTNYPQPKLKGEIEIKNGYLNNLRFFVWLSDFFSIPELKKIDFRHIQGAFKINEQNAVFDQIRLESDQIAVGAAFGLNKNEFISSRISLTLPRELLATSPKFQLLLALISSEIEEFTFNFQLSGLYNSINFKWLESDFKQKIQDMLPGFIERGIERKIERAVKSIAASTQYGTGGGL